MSEKTPINDRKKTVFRSPYLKIIVPGLFWLGMVIILAFSYGDAFWLWVTRAFDLSFILYTVAVIYGLYVYLPKFGASLGGLIMSGIQGFFTQSKMKDLSEKGVAARQVKAQQMQALEMVAAIDPIKGAIVPFVQDAIENNESIPKAIRSTLASNAGAMLTNSPVNFTGWLIGIIDQKFPQAHLSENLKALGVITNAEKIA